MPRVGLLPACRPRRSRAYPRFPPLVNAAVCEFSGGGRVEGGPLDLSDHRALVETGDLEHEVATDDVGVERHRRFLVYFVALNSVRSGARRENLLILLIQASSLHG